MNRKEQIKQIKNNYDKLSFLNNYSWTHYRNKIYQLSLKSEKQHRSPGHPDVPKDFGPSVAGKLFTVQYILEGMIEGMKSRKKSGPTMPMSIVHGLRYEYLYGRSVGVGYCHEINKRIPTKEAKEYLASVDYAELMR